MRHLLPGLLVLAACAADPLADGTYVFLEPVADAKDGALGTLSVQGEVVLSALSDRLERVGPDGLSLVAPVSATASWRGLYYASFTTPAALKRSADGTTFEAVPGAPPMRALFARRDELLGVTDAWKFVRSTDGATFSEAGDLGVGEGAPVVRFSVNSEGIRIIRTQSDPFGNADSDVNQVWRYTPGGGLSGPETVVGFLGGTWPEERVVPGLDDLVFFPNDRASEEPGLRHPEYTGVVYARAGADVATAATWTQVLANRIPIAGVPLTNASPVGQDASGRLYLHAAKRIFRSKAPFATNDAEARAAILKGPGCAERVSWLPFNKVSVDEPDQQLTLQNGFDVPVMAWTIDGEWELEPWRGGEPFLAPGASSVSSWTKALVPWFVTDAEGVCLAAGRMPRVGRDERVTVNVAAP